MNNSQGALYFGAGIDTANWKRDIESMRRDILGLNNTVRSETQQMDSAFKNLGIGIAGYLSANTLKSFVMELINVRGEFQKTEIAYSTMLGSSEKAKNLMGQMVSLAAKTPFSFQEVATGAKQLLAFQVPANQVIDVLTRLGNISAGLGVPLSRINLVYGQVMAKGRLMGDDLRQFTEAGIPMVAELAKKFNTTSAAITEMVSAGKIGFKDVQDVLFGLTNEGGMFYNLMEKQSASLSGKVANLGDQWDQMLNKIGASNEGILYGGIEGLTHLIEHYEEMFEIIKTLVLAYGAYKAAIIITASAQEFSNKTIASEIGLLSFSQRMKLGRALVTQRQTAATLLEAQAEQSSLATKYATLQAEVASLAVKKQKAVALGIERAQTLGNARVQLVLAQAELRSLQANGTAREVLIATKNVEKAQNTVIAAQDSASIARKAAMTAGNKFYTAQKELEVTATALSSVSKNVETAAEVANAAAKSANTIATARLTLAQTAQTIAMTAAARAASFLNATLFANPYALATALIAALTYAVYKYSTALTQAQESQNRMNDDMKSQIPTITEQESKLNSLVKVIGDHKTSEDLRASSIKQVQSLTNGRLGQLDEEAVKTGKATSMIKQYIDMLKLEAEAKRYVNELGRLDADVQDLKSNKGSFGLGDMWDDFTDFDSSFQWNLKDRKKERVDRIVKEKESEKIELQKKLDDLAKKGVNISETPINETPTSVGKKGWAQSIKDQIEALEVEANSATTRTAYLRIQAKIKSLQELLNPKKEKKDNKQIAEFLPMGSIKELQQRAQLIQEAMDVAVNSQVKLRKLDKYGKDKDKNGNPFLTGEVISSQQAFDQIQAINDKVKELQIKSFDEQTAELERRIKIRDQIIQSGYSKEVADSMFPDLAGKDLLKSLQELQADINSKISSGKGTKGDAENYAKISATIDTLLGKQSALDKFNSDTDKALSKIRTEADKLIYLKDLQSNLSDSDVSSGFYSNLEERIRNSVKQQQDAYQNLLVEHQSFEEKRNEIADKASKERLKILEDESLTPEKKAQLTKSVTTESNQQISDVAVEEIEKSSAWMALYSGVQELTAYQMQVLIEELEKKAPELKKVMTPIDFSLMLKKLKETKARITEMNPFQGMFNAATGLLQTFNAETDETAEATFIKFKSVSDSVKSLLQSTTGAVRMFDSIREYMSDSANDTMDTIEQVATFGMVMMEAIDTTVTAVKSALDNASWSNWITAIISIIYTVIKAVVSLFSWIGGNKKKKMEKEVKEWKSVLNELENAYKDLEVAATKAYGAMKYDGQRQLIKNIEEQQKAIEEMKNAENKKKKADQDKINEWNNQQADNVRKMQEIRDGIIRDVLQTDIPDMASKLGDALVEAFGKGEDGMKAINNAFDDLIKNMLKNQLNLVLQGQLQPVIKKMLSAAGFNENGEGSFNGLTPQEIAEIRAMYEAAAANGQQFIQAYSDIFGELQGQSSSLTGAIKGMSEEAASVLAGQFNAIRINVGEILLLMSASNLNGSQAVSQLIAIEFNTRRLHNMDKNLQILATGSSGSLRAAGLV